MSRPDPALALFAEQLNAELRYEADLEGAEAMVPEVFTRRMLEALLELGELEEAVDCYHANDGVRPAVETYGYGLEDEDTLNLVTTLFRGAPPRSVTRAELDRALRRCRAFWQRCRERPYHDELEESSDAWDMALHVRQVAPSIRRVRLFVLTDGISPIEWTEPLEENGVEYRTQVWDLRRLWRAESHGSRGEPIEIDFQVRFGSPLPALEAPRSTGEYRAFVTVVPGEWLAAIYDEFGSRLLERNVRSFLQFAGKVNRGMRDTLRDEPERFLAYNNGISATASDVELMDLHDGGTAIRRIRDLQIVNGGQTTASIHRSMRNRVDVSQVAIQAKITVVEGDLLDELVPRISEYANSQNKVQLADLSSNDPFHIEMELLSRSIWAPATRATPRQTRWFYERARGQYNDALGRESTRARQRQFKEMHPQKQRFAKVDLATFENTWDQRPHEVSKGAQKNFGDFMARLGGRRSAFRPDAAYFQRAVAKAILFRRAERIVSAQQFGGYRRNIVAYALAKLSFETQQRLNLMSIWMAQDVPEPVERAIEDLSHLAFRILTDEDRPARNVTEWAKRSACWERMRSAPWTEPAPLGEHLVSLASASGTATSGATPSEDEQTASLGSDAVLAQEMSELDGGVFLAISNWAKQTDNLSPWDRRFAYSVGAQLNRGRSLSVKQAPIAQRILEEARSRGFDPTLPEAPSI